MSDTKYFLVPDIHALQYVAVQAAVLQVSGIWKNINKPNYRDCENKILWGVVALKID